LAENTKIHALRPALDAEALAALSARLGDDEAVAALRRAARTRYLSAADPDRVSHLWRFTNPEWLLPAGFELAETSAAPSPDLDGAVARVLLRAGAAPVVASSAAAESAGLVLRSLADCGEELAALPAALETDGLFQHLNAAAWNTGLYVELPADARLDGPVHVVVDAGAGAVLPRLVVVAGAGSELVLVEEHAGGSPTARVVGGTELHAGANARLRHVLVQTWQEGVRGHLTARGRAGRDADLLSVFVSLGGDRSKLELTTELQGEGARSEMLGVALGGGAQRFDHHTRHRHVAGRTWSNIDFKAVADETSRSSYTGLIRIEETARDTEAFQENRNLLLGDHSRADTIPELEILNEDVSCSHGATVAPIDPEQLFYLESRGVDPDAAMRLVVRGFLDKTLSRLPEVLRETIEGLVADRLARLKRSAA
jgi:Fe-S cluster assembly protein SufD